MPEQINTDMIIDTAVRQAMETMNADRIIIKQSYYTQIQSELNAISIYFHQVSRSENMKRSSGLTNPYAPEFGFDTSAIAYEITKIKKDQAIVYNRINKILSYLRQGQEINYALYVKDINNKMHRYMVPESQIEQFTTIVQTSAFKMDADLREFAETAIERLENAQRFSEHMDEFMRAVDSALAGTKLSLKLADKYEAFEYHYQSVDKPDDNFTHGFDIESLRTWLLTRGHDTAGWWVRGDIGLTSVKSINLNNKFLFLNLATQKSLQEVYGLLTELFSTNVLSAESISRLVKAFTPAAYELKAGMKVDVNSIVTNLISSLTK